MSGGAFEVQSPNGALTTAGIKRVGRPPKYPLSEIGVGESFDVPLAFTFSENGRDLAAYRLHQSACQYALRRGGKFRTKTLRREGVVRCTRVA